MPLTMPSAVTGSTQTGFTSPTYTLTAIKPTQSAKQSIVTALGGTQAGVLVHSVNNPFYLAVYQPAQLKQLGGPNVNTGLVRDVPNNVYRLLVRKGGIPYASNPPRNIELDLSFKVPAGVEDADAPAIKAAVSMFIGALNSLSAELGTLASSGSV